jgi:uncharacterized protein (TIGR03435 family)
MRRSLVSAGLTAFASLAAFGQTAAAPPAFEVASIKPTAPSTDGRVMRRVGGDPGLVDYTNVTLKIVLARAYGVKDYQISGPDWLDTEGFDIKAKVPDGVPKEQIPAMLQTLLAERFGLTLHKETKTLPVYALTVAKGGVKMKEVDAATVAANATAGRGGPLPGSPPPPGSMATGGANVSFNSSSSGVKINGGAPPPGAVTMMMGPNGRILRGQMTMPRFADILAQNMDRPVLDATELKGTYEIELNYMPDESDRMSGQLGAMFSRAAAAAGAPPSGHSGGANPAGTPEQKTDAPVGNLFQALQEKGLKLEQRKSPVEFLIIDKANKVPTEN